VNWLLKFLRTWFRPNHAPQFWFSRQAIQAVKDDSGLITLYWHQDFILTPVMALHLLEYLEQGGEISDILRRVQDHCPPLPASSQELRAELRKLVKG
jgi:hypothetical protein